jgi:hypothetical protein
VQGQRTLPVIMQFLELRQRLLDVKLNSDTEDRLVWRWTASGQYSSSSAYAAMFLGQATAPSSVPSSSGK